MEKIFIFGSGNVATHLAQALQKAGYSIIGIYSRTLENAKALANRLNCPLATNQISDIPEAQIYVFAVKDDALAPLVAQLSKHPTPPNALFLHTAGSLPLSVLSENYRNAGVLYPMQTFSKSRSIDFHDVPLFIEGCNDESRQRLNKLAQALSNSVTELTSAQRSKLHLAAVFACNFSNQCYAIAGQILTNAGISPQALLPLIDETTRKVHTMPATEAQTGPAIRWDVQVMNKHLDALSESPTAQLVYKIMSQSIHEMANKQTNQQDTQRNE